MFGINSDKRLNMRMWKLRMWHWRDVLCWFKLKLSKDGYLIKEFCGKCEKCNRLFAACGVIPCPMRFKKNIKQENYINEDNTPDDVSLSKQNIWVCGGGY